MAPVIMGNIIEIHTQHSCQVFIAWALPDNNDDFIENIQLNSFIFFTMPTSCFIVVDSHIHIVIKLNNINYSLYILPHKIS